MKSFQISITEKLVLFLVAIMLIVGYVLFYTDVPTFEWYVREDHLVEWFTVFGLLAGCFVSISRFFRLFKQRNWWFLTVTFLLAVLLFVAAGEEVSWGQRIFHIKSSEYFAKHNAQGETNLHNLVVDGVKLNKLIFSTLLSISLGVYLVLLPILYQVSAAVRRFIDFSGVPVAKLYEIIAFAILVVATSLLHHEKNAELLEGGAAWLFFLIVRFPKNAGLFSEGFRA